MRADYHFHPNLQGKSSARRLRALWKAIGRHRIDAIICTEHTFKNAPNAYRRMIAAKPDGSATHVFAGAELVTNDGMGIDVIAFADRDWYDDHPLLLEPFALSLREMITYLEATNLQYFIPHPYLIKNPLKDLFDSPGSMRAFLERVPGYEAFNGCYLGLERFLGFPLLRRLFLHFRRQLRESARPPQEYLPPEPVQFIAVGSDAHHPSEIGLCVDVDCPDIHSARCVFAALITNTDIRSLHYSRKPAGFLQLCRMAWTTFTESTMRRAWIIRRYLERTFGEKEITLATDIIPEHSLLTETDMPDDIF